MAEAAPPGPPPASPVGWVLPAPVRRIIHDLARRSVREFVESRVRIEPPAGIAELAEPRGVFVTLRLAERLRGCVGFPLPADPLGRAVVDAAISAASEDRRFPPVMRVELASIEIEVSVLSVPENCGPEDVVAGEHGLIVSHAGRRGLLLPQVAREQGWNRERLLAETCRKAGLPADAWLHGAVLSRFSADVIGAL